MTERYSGGSERFCGCTASTTHVRMGEVPDVTVVCIECGGIAP